MMALKMLLVGLDLSRIVFVLGVTEETILEWPRRATEKAKEINQYLLRDLNVVQIQLDETWKSCVASTPPQRRMARGRLESMMAGSGSGSARRPRVA